MATISEGQSRQDSPGIQMGETGSMALAGIVARVINAAFVFLSQILFARLMGVEEFGAYAFANQLMLLMAGIALMGLVMVPQRYLPEYDLSGDRAAEKGLVRFALVAPLLIGSGFALGGLLLALGGQTLLGPSVALATALAMLTVPAQVSLDIVEGIAMARGWKMLSYGIGFILRPLLVPALFLLAWLSGRAPDALLATLSGVAAAWIAAAVLLVLVYQKTRPSLKGVKPHYEMGIWFRASLPVMAIHTAYMLMTTTDIVALALFRTTAEVGTYSAGARLVALVAFIYHGLTWATAHHFSRLNATGDEMTLKSYAQRATLWTFFPSLVVAIGVAVLTPLLLLLFGGDFAGALPVTLILLVGLLARAAVGPAEQLLIMTDHQITCAYAYGWAFVANVALCLLLVPIWGGIGAALATAAGYALASIIIAREVRYSFGFPVGIFSILRQQKSVSDSDAPNPSVSVALEARTGASPALEQMASGHSPFAADRIQQVQMADGGIAHALVFRENDKIIGVWPMRRQTVFGLFDVLKGPNDAGFETDGDPVIAPGRELDCVKAIARAMQAGQLPTGMIMAQNLSRSGPFWQALETLHGGGVLSLNDLERWSRPMLIAQPGLTAASYISASQGKRKQDGIDRRLRRLRDRGKVAFVLLKGADALPAMDRFLALEASGWKGAGGTAIAQDQGRQRYMRELCSAFAELGALAIGELTLDGTTIASGILAERKGCYTFLRTTYDQNYASTSPGTLLDYVLIDHLMSDRAFQLLDAGTDSSVSPGRLLFADTSERVDALISFGNPLKTECVIALRTLRGMAKRLRNGVDQAKYRSRRVP
jgi:O-antigen/teichoic acid export membrane protein